MLKLIVFTVLFFGSLAFSLTNVDKAALFEGNLLDGYNPGCESGLASWTVNGTGTFAITSSSADLGKGAITCKYTSSIGTVNWVETKTAITVPAGLKGRNGVLSILAKTSYDGYQLMLVDGSSNTIASKYIAVTSGFQRQTLNFIWPSSGSVKVRIHSISYIAPPIYFDDVYLGAAEGINIAQVSQAEMIGSAYFAQTASCFWSRTNTALGAFGTTAACPGPTIENTGSGSWSWQTTDTDLPKITINNLPPGQYTVAVTGQGSISAGSGINESFAINDGITTSGTVSKTVDATGNTNAQFTILSNFTYTAAGNRTFELYGSASANRVDVLNRTAEGPLRFVITKFPSSSETIYQPDLSAQSWSGYHTATCSWTRTNAAYGDPAADATCSLVERTNNNFGTVTTYQSGGNALPGIVFSVPTAATYFVCARVTAHNDSAGTLMQFRMWDGTTTIEEFSSHVYAVTGYKNIHTACGLYSATTPGSKTISIQSASAAGTVTMSEASISLEWSIMKVSQSLPMPLILNSVQSSASNVEVINRATVANTNAGQAVSSQSGSWTSIASCSSAGVCTYNITAGTYSVAPSCVCSSNNVGANICEVTAISTTQYTVRTLNSSFVPSNEGVTKVICMGPK